MDGGTATIIANGRAQPDRQNVSVYEKRGLEVLTGPASKPVGDSDHEQDGSTREAIPYSPELAKLLGLADDEDALDDVVDDDLEDDEWD
jgi:hypothetical protein